MIARVVVLLALLTLLGGCMQATIGSVAGGECKIFERPTYVVLGKRPYDQDWIDSQVEGGVGGCKWKRPAQRPPELDAKAGQVVIKPAPAKRRGIIKRIRYRILPAPKPAEKPTWPPAAAPIAPVLNPPPPPVAKPPEKPRSALDELLDPSGRGK
ncbi:hypothetical protein [Bradyrhizobium sp. JYMT SZCCT0428]|uniref:hypothetical protein n=1 Tax=Bradyrhizobium sp. JYMT SZCCT0428 TaxID=2807673 RepID=UPI001BAA3761|nr:hypothetical protein [Bradyrhizobium sp. JYMT SZCCT0428]MBR1150068.1 hypothetical protein [Bradyrhizobium sp. JYMT SZCCT0428]